MSGHRLASRKFWAFVILQILFVSMTYDDKLSGDQFVNLTEWLWGLYVLGNVGEHGVKQWNGGGKAAGGAE